MEHQMSLIQKCGGQGQAELIASLVLTHAFCPHGYIPKLQMYFAELDRHIYIYDEEKHEYLPYMDVDQVSEDLVWLEELRSELQLSIA